MQSFRTGLENFGGTPVVGTGSILAIWGGRLSATLLFVSGASHLWPPPPAIDQELHTMFLFVAAMVPLTIGEFVAFYVGVLEITPKNGRGLLQARTLQNETFSLLREGAATLEKIINAALGRDTSRHHGDKNDQ